MKPDAGRWVRFLLATLTHYSGLDALYRRLAGPGLAVLMLHRVRDAPDPYPLSMSRGGMRQLIEWLRARDALVGLDDGLSALANPGARPGTRYAITFDDGYRDNLHLLDPALPPVPAVVYVATDHMGGEPIWVYQLLHAVEARSNDYLDLGVLGLGSFDLGDADERTRLHAVVPPRLKELQPAEIAAAVASIVAQTRPHAHAAGDGEMLSWDEVRLLEARGIEIGGHTCSHTLLSRVDEATAFEEIAGSHARIARETSRAPRHFAYPNGGIGDFDERDAQLARAAGFATAATSIEGVNRPGCDPYRILRYNVHEDRYRTPSGRLSKALFFSETSGLLGWLRGSRTAW